MKNSALVVGSTGIAGSNLAKELVAQGWETYGLSRNPSKPLKGVHQLRGDLLDPGSLKEALSGINPTHVFFTTWMRQENETENIRVNSTLVRNMLDVLSLKRSVAHVALVTGLKHYLGPFESYAKTGNLPGTPVREDQGRLTFPNFYYAQEDVVFEAAARDGFTWSVHRPHTIIGEAVGNLMNMGTTLAVYATWCKERGLPMVWPGSREQWSGLSDVTDARILAKQLVWAATTPAAQNQAFNVANGDVFRWNRLWFDIADWFGIAAEGFVETIRPLESTMTGIAEDWTKIVKTHGLKESHLERLISPWHTDLDLGRPLEVVTDMTKSRKLGFTAYQDTRDSFFDLFKSLRTGQIIP
ncbi:SDR family oxidoreductase [Sphingobacterium psychroaquaticum]|uniref:SDR family oxidoreductase n=1 Tax=Sphingobacterium psychroaquaticum TaxID=561061 RepID=UPI001068D493|nr:SDR family oxidoreductase [Sphingobacterium psychroaquaticum]QBQ40783.1 SDR family oxidoreductase [Sphingobacterium psychroaquaticum]